MRKGFSSILIVGLATVAVIVVGIVGYTIFKYKLTSTTSTTQQSPPKESLDIAPCDINTDGNCNVTDLNLLNKALGANRGQRDYIPLADIDANGVINDIDKQMLLKLLDQNQKDETTDWKVFKSGKATYEFKYPKDWTLNTPDGVLELSDQVGTKIISIGSFNPSIVGVWHCQAKEDTARCETTKVGDTSAVIDWGGSGEANVLIVVNESGLSITLHQVNSETKNIFRTFLSTFKFLD